ncbi:twin transmembrane helix small protein [Asticcacaulis sp. EMRT-3]|uniref:twin transmembrane helix small protein n=1 Tax=Asticcacaulis sp. EMRT-3 TaxID=3040349 RepID=UPI0024AE9864|nr:twin transmembrane helix small protein [Asticcacaulis sp. EMRT-3]MDI7775435.1 twin transmembrane helix small protein [Asticcacaulis sp. EMRT-3]
MSLVLFILAVIAMLAVLVVLGAGFYSLARGGEFRRNWSNKLMRLRILFQFIALCLLVATAWAFHKGL